MLQAKNKQGQLQILADLSREEISDLRQNEQFYCPTCSEKVIIKAGSQVIAHFAHQIHSDCSTQLGGEGPYHEQGKYLLFQWLQAQQITAALEVYLPEIAQRPDILITIGVKRIALEFQCAKVPIQVIQKRNRGYAKLGIRPIWILAAKEFKRLTHDSFKVSPFTLQFLHQFSTGNPTSLYYFCPQTKRISIISDLLLTTMRRAIAHIQLKELSNASFIDLFSYEYFSDAKLYSLWKREQRRYRLGERRRAYGSELAYRNWLYGQGIYQDQLPSVINLPIRSQYRMKVPLYNWQSRLVLDFIKQFQINDCFDLMQAKTILRYYMHPETMFPLLKDPSDPVEEYLLQLVKLNYLVEISPGKFQVTKAIPFYQSIEVAMKGDQITLEKLSGIRRNRLI